MVMLVLAVEGDVPTPSWWESLGSWTYESCRAFLTHLAVAHPTERASNGEALLALKLGSCWGGWDCNNPSYHAPAHYTAMRDFMTAFASRWGTTSDEAAALAPQWDALIETSYRIIDDAQCTSTGLVPNWFVPAQSSLSTAGTAGCSGSGTPAGEFGSEASRTAWRLALGWLWYGDQTAARLSLLMATHAGTALANYGPLCLSASSCTALQLTPACLVSSIHADWTSNGFMLAPVASTFMVPPTDTSTQSTQQAALDTAATLLAASTITGYYSGSWVAIGTLTLSTFSQGLELRGL
eukprot:657895-Prymnesium_polylepis.1